MDHEKKKKRNKKKKKQQKNKGTEPTFGGYGESEPDYSSSSSSVSLNVPSKVYDPFQIQVPEDAYLQNDVSDQHVNLGHHSHLPPMPEKAQKLTHATSSSEHLPEAKDDPCENSNEPRIVTEPENKSEISTAIVEQDKIAETCEDAVKCSQEAVETNDKATNSSLEADKSTKNDGICENIIEPKNEVQTYDMPMEPNDNEAINSTKEAYKVDDEPSKEGEFYEEIGEPIEKIDSCRERNEVETLLRPYLAKETQGSLTPTPTPDDTVYVTCPSSQIHPALGSGVGATACQQNNDFQGLQVSQHLVPLLEKARDKYGDFHNSPLIKSQAVRITAMESVGQVLEILQTQTLGTIDAEMIQFMEDTVHDLSIMSFPIEWLSPLIDKGKKWLQRKAKIDEMEAQLQALKRQMEKEKALDQPLLDM